MADEYEETEEDRRYRAARFKGTDILDPYAVVANVHERREARERQADTGGLALSRIGHPESRQRLRDLEIRHASTVSALTDAGFDESHTGLAYHADMLGKVRTEMQRIGMTPREGGAPVIEEGMEQQAWRNINKPD